MTIKGFENEDNTFDFKECIIAHCRTLDKDDVYQWVADDEVKINNLLEENQQLKEQLKEQLEASERARKEAIEFIKEYEKNQNLLKWNEEDYIDVINEIKKYLDIDKGE